LKSSNRIRIRLSTIGLELEKTLISMIWQDPLSFCRKLGPNSKEVPRLEELITDSFLSSSKQNNYSLTNR